MMSKKDSSQTLIPREDDAQWQQVLRGEIVVDPDNETHQEAKKLREYLLSTELQEAENSLPAQTLITLSPQEAKIAYHRASDEIHKRAKSGRQRWFNYSLVLLFGAMAGLMGFFASHYFSTDTKSDANLPAASNNRNRVDIQSFGDKYHVQTADEKHGKIPNLLPIPSGTFTMGCSYNWDDAPGGCKDSEHPAHMVTIKAFELAQHEVTVGQFRHFAESSGYTTISEKKGCVIRDKKSISPRWIIDNSTNWRSTGFEQGDSHPVVCITRRDALAYIDWLNKTTNKQYRLPTETEWEYAARGGSATAYSWGNQADHNRANLKGVNGLDIWEYTAPVGSFPSNHFSLQDMLGNAWEWVSDCWHDNYVAAPNDGSSWNTNCHGNDFITRRGGAWDAPPLSIRSAYRNYSGIDDRSHSYGFRIAHDLTEAKDL